MLNGYVSLIGTFILLQQSEQRSNKKISILSQVLFGELTVHTVLFMQSRDVSTVRLSLFFFTFLTTGRPEQKTPLGHHCLCSQYLLSVDSPVFLKKAHTLLKMASDEGSGRSV